MKLSFENRCARCFLYFCCPDCRWNHEKLHHTLELNCPICHGARFLCHPRFLKNIKLIEHVVKYHLPLQCERCDQHFLEMEDFLNIDKCSSMSELIVINDNIENHSKEIEDRFESLYCKDTSQQDDDYEAIVSINKLSKSAVITPVVRKGHIVDYETSSSENESPMEKVQTPHGKTPKTPRIKRAATPHFKKYFIRQRTLDEECNNGEDNDESDMTQDGFSKVLKYTPATPNHDEASDDEVTTPTSNMIPSDKLVNAISSAVTTSTPTHAIPGTWSLFPEPGADSPLSEIEGTTGDGSPAQSIDEVSKTETSDNLAPKLKSIMMTSRIKGSQDSMEKQVTYHDSYDASSLSKNKKVKFADDTVFKFESKPVSRVFRKPKRLLTPGPQRPVKYCNNPRFQALINRFEIHGKTLARTPSTVREIADVQQETPPGDGVNIQARAINFKEDPGSIEKYEENLPNDSFKTCTDTSMNLNVVANNAISTLTTNIAGSIQTCLRTALQANDEETEIQLKFTITRKTVRIKKVVDDGNDVDEKSCEVKRPAEGNKENLWTSVARAVKKVFWGDTNNAVTPNSKSYSSISSLNSSGTKRKCSDVSELDESPINHKRQKCEGRIRGRPPIHGSDNVRPIFKTQSADQKSFVNELHTAYSKEDPNFSF